MKKVIGYVRASTDEQETTLLAQEEKIREFCKINNFDLVDILIDKGVSGGTDIYSRPEGSKIKQLVKSKEIQAVVIIKLDRMFRSVSNALSMAEEWEKKNVGLYILDFSGQVMDTSTAIGKIIFTMLSAVAEFERNLTGERTKAVLAHKKKNGKKYSQVPFGFNERDKTLIVNNEEIKIVEEVISRFNTGESLRVIANSLNDRGVRTKKGRYWHASSVRNIVSNNIYASVCA